jgi:hypothetical protein
MTANYARYLPAIVGRMLAENIKDLSDGEIERTLSPCVGGRKLVQAAKRLRDSGTMREYLTETFRGVTVPNDPNTQNFASSIRITRLVTASIPYGSPL